MRGINDLRLCLCADFPSFLIMHGKKRADRNLNLALACYIRHISPPIDASLNLSRSKIFPAELLLYMGADIRHYIILILLDASPEADCISVLKKHTFIIRIERQVNQKYKKKNRP